MAAATSIKFTARRRPAVLVAPASPTPRELKRLSDLDDQDSLRHHIPSIYFYGRKESMAMMGGKDKDPAVVIRDAVARALVPYYPLAGRLRELDDGGDNKLAVDCTAEGVLFVEADADVRLEDLGGHPLLPPFPCLEELVLDDVPGGSSSDILDTPLLLFQLTRLACGGFVLAVRLNHTMADGVGLTQFLGAVAELARGDARAPSTTVPDPVWERHLLEAAPRNSPPPRRDELDVYYDDDDSSSSSNMLMSLSPDDMALRHFFFGPGEIAAIRAQLSMELQKRASRFDVVAGWLWKHRTAALALDNSDDEAAAPLIITVDARGRCGGSIPAGYYGNAFATPVAVSTAGELRANPVGYAVALVKEAKDKVDMEYMRSAAGIVARRRGRVPRIPAGAYSLTDETKVRFDGLDFGWGTPVYAGPARPGGVPALPWVSSFILPFKNADGEDGAVVPVSLPCPALDRLVHEMGELLRMRPPDDRDVDTVLVQQPRRHVFPAKRSAL